MVAMIVDIKPHYSRLEYFNRTGMPLCVLTVDAQSAHRSHDHDFTELVVVAAGQGDHVTGGKKYSIGTGDVFVVHSAETHSYRNTKGLRLFNVIFDIEKLGLPLKDMKSFPGFHALFTLEPRLRARSGFRSRLNLSPVNLAVVIDLLDNIHSEQEQKRPVYQCMAASLFLQVVGLLSRCYTNIADPESRELLRLSAALEHMELTLDQPIKLTDLARLAHMSKSSFQRAFRRVLNSAPIDYVIRLRIRKAADLLLTNSMLVKEAAAAVGFNDSNYFTRQFRKIMRVNSRAFAEQAFSPVARRKRTI